MHLLHTHMHVLHTHMRDCLIEKQMVGGGNVGLWGLSPGPPAVAILAQAVQTIKTHEGLPHLKTADMRDCLIYKKLT